MSRWDDTPYADNVIRPFMEAHPEACRKRKSNALCDFCGAPRTYTRIFVGGKFYRECRPCRAERKIRDVRNQENFSRATEPKECC